MEYVPSKKIPGRVAPGRINNKLTRARREELDPARRPVRPPREEEREVDAVIVQPRREVQGVRLVEAVAIQ